MASSTTPTTTIQLPSRGVFYKNAAGEPLLPEGKVQIRKWTMHELGVLEGQGAGTSDRLRKIINDCCILPTGLDANQLLMTDRFAILICQRSYSLNTSKYKFDFKCPYCNAVNRGRTMDFVADFNEKAADPAAVEPFQIDLPDAGAKVEFRFLRGYDEPAVIDAAKRYKMASNDSGDPSRMLRMARQIVTIDGNGDLKIMDKESWVSKLTAGDVARFVNAVDGVEPCIDTTFFCNCSSCGTENEVNLEGSFSGEFFRPTSL